MTHNTFSAHRTLRWGVVRVEAKLNDFAFPAHSHGHACVGLVRDGEHDCRYGRRRHVVQRDDVMLVNPWEVHDGRPSGWCGRQYSMLEIDPQALRGICVDAIGRERIEFQKSVVRDPRLNRALFAWLGSLAGEDTDMEREFAVMFFGLLSSNKDGPRSRAAGELATRASQRMRERCTEADAIGHLSIEFGVSRYQLIRAFKRAFGLTPEDFRRQLRVERARSLLAGRRTLVEIAVEAGFADQSHMTREMRRVAGLTPGGYRSALQ